MQGATIAFSIDGVSAGTATANANGFAQLPYRVDDSLAVGAHTLVASYADDAHSFPCSATSALTALQTPTLLIGSNLSGKAGVTLALRVRLKRISDLNGVSGQSIGFKLDGNLIGVAVTSIVGIASLSYVVPEMPIGSHVLTAEYVATSQYLGSISAGTLTTAKSDTSLPTGDRRVCSPLCSRSLKVLEQFIYRESVSVTIIQRVANAYSR